MKDNSELVTKTFTMRLPPSLLAFLQEEAKSNYRCLSNQIMIILTDYTKTKKEKFDLLKEPL